MPRVLAISGSPSLVSRTAALLARVADRIAADGHEVTTLSVRDVPADVLIGADRTAPAAAAFAAAVAAADGLVVATPVYQASYSGALKSLLDLLPQHALAAKVVLPLATSGSVAHMLALDYALRPVLAAMGAGHVVPGYLVPASAITSGHGVPAVIDSDTTVALHRVVDGFTAALQLCTREPALVTA